jgi:chemotaxis protein MotD
MTKTDPLMAMLRQLGAGKAASRTAPNVTITKDHKGKVEDNEGKVEQFGEQLRLVARGAKQGPQPDLKKTETDPAQGPAQDMEVPDRVADVADEVTPRSKDRARRPAENSPHRSTGETTSSPPEWRAPDAALSSVMSRLDHARAFSPRDDGPAPRVAQPQPQVEQRAMPLQPDELTKGPKAGTLPEPSFASSIGAVETRTAPPVKVAVREQETHFEPVPQLTLLQKIVDRISPDLPTAPAQPASGAAEVALPDILQTPGRPVRMLTLQLDPPSMGTVTVRMRLAGDAVEVRLSADRQETTQLLREERGALMDAMQSAGYTFDIASIDHSAGSDANPNAGQPHAQSDQQPSQQSNGGPHIGNGTSERQSSDAQAGGRHNRQGHDQIIKPAERHQDERVALDRSGGAGGAVYL